MEQKDKQLNDNKKEKKTAILVSISPSLLKEFDDHIKGTKIKRSSLISKLIKSWLKKSIAIREKAE